MIFASRRLKDSGSPSTFQLLGYESLHTFIKRFILHINPCNWPVFLGFIFSFWPCMERGATNKKTWYGHIRPFLKASNHLNFHRTGHLGLAHVIPNSNGCRLTFSILHIATLRESRKLVPANSSPPFSKDASKCKFNDSEFF